MTYEALARLHSRAMTFPAPWDARAIANLMETPGTFVTTLPLSFQDSGGQREENVLKAFAIGRVTLDEAELLTLAVDPDYRRTGLGSASLDAFESAARGRSATRAFLEVAATNTAARALYRKAGYTEDGLRKGYYHPKDAAPIDAILMSKPLLTD